MATYAETTAAILEYTQNDNTDFIARVPDFIRASEERISYFVQLPNFRKAQTGTFTASNAYLQLPADFLAPASLALVQAAGPYVYLINTDVSFIRETYPNPATTGEPRHYALFDADEDDTVILVGPTPDLSYETQLNYFYRPASLVDAGSNGNDMAQCARL
jgi:hypothetical protein